MACVERVAIVPILIERLRALDRSPREIAGFVIPLEIHRCERCDGEVVEELLLGGQLREFGERLNRAPNYTALDAALHRRRYHKALTLDFPRDTFDSALWHSEAF
jgi:hypothetical protein